MAKAEKDPNAIDQARRLQNVPWCDDYEKMISGMPFRSWDLDLIEARRKTRAKCDELNRINSNGAGVLERQKLLQSLVEGAEDANFEGTVFVSYGCNTRVGKGVYANTGLSIDDSAFVTIGDNVCIGPEVHFITLNHSTAVAERLRGVMYAKPIVIGDACWIGARVTILPGASIGYGCTIGAAAVVSGQIPANSVAVGSPARVVKNIASE